jgi:Rrf2 family transcriptional regulator, cysteine metabolism repressor
MRISTKGRYGLRAMVDLTINSEVDHVTLKSIAERQDISENYLEQVFSTLRKARLVKSIKGAQGGYILGDKPANMKVGDILRVLEGTLSITDEEKTSGNVIEKCLSESVWQRIDSSIAAVVDSITLDELAAISKKANSNLSLMYYI